LSSGRWTPERKEDIICALLYGEFDVNLELIREPESFKMDVAELIRSSIEASIACKEQVLRDLPGPIETAGRWIADALGSGDKLLIFGNGGSAADAQHIAGELVGRFMRERRAAAAIALSTDTSVLTAVANDYGYEQVFARQIEALGAPGDVALAISTSGNSPNILAGIRRAKAAQLRVIGLLGRDGGQAAEEVDLALVVSGSESARIQESHILIAHILCHLVEESLFGQTGR